MQSPLQPGTRVIVESFADNPEQAVEQHMRLVDMAPPDPSSLGPSDVIVAVRSASINWVDLLMTSGQYQHMPQPPYTPGLEYAGTIAWLGSSAEGRGFHVGDSVFVDGFLAGPRSLGAYQAWGGFASYAVAPIEAVRALPPGFGFDEACNLLGNYETAYHCLVVRGGLQAGETVLIHGASGSTGLAAVHVAKLVGATVIATGRSDDKLALVRGEGADHVLNIRPQSADEKVRRFREDVRALTGGAGVDLVYDGVGGDVSVESLRAMKFGARFVIVGWAATPNVSQGRGQRGAPNANQLPTNIIMMKGLSILGSPTIISTVHNPSIRHERLARIMGWVAEGKLRPKVSHRFPLSEFRAGMLAKWRGECVGGAVLHP